MLAEYFQGRSLKNSKDTSNVFVLTSKRFFGFICFLQNFNMHNLFVMLMIADKVYANRLILNVGLNI